MRKLLFVAFSVIIALPLLAQPPATREELERQKNQLKKELEQTQKMLTENKTKFNENYLQLRLASDKVELQDRLIDNINKDINILDNNLYTTQREINRYNRLLDTLKQEYAKSMVYAYKNRSNYDYLNFIFSASSFNDAIKRITYLKSYRDYREMQGQNILHTQELRKRRLDELSNTKQQKSDVLVSKDNEMAVLEKEKAEKDRIINELKKQGKQLNDKITKIRKQAKTVDNAIAAAIKRAMELARKEAKAKADKAAKEAAAAKAAAAKAAASNTTSTNTAKVKTTPIKEQVTVKTPESVLLNDANIELNTEFMKNKGSLPWPVDKGYLLMHYGSNRMPVTNTVIVTTGLTIATDIGSQVKTVFGGTVSSIIYVDEMQVVIIQHGKYFSTYSNLSSVSVQKGQQVQIGQVIGRAAANFDGIGAVDFYISDEKSNQDPERWLRRKS